MHSGFEGVELVLGFSRGSMMMMHWKLHRTFVATSKPWSFQPACFNQDSFSPS